MFADIAAGHHATADVLFLIALILAGTAALAAVVPVEPRSRTAWTPLAGWASVACLAAAWLIL
jgi:hypothetical protein